jgi:hypothetical protein
MKINVDYTLQESQPVQWTLSSDKQLLILMFHKNRLNNSFPSADVSVVRDVHKLLSHLDWSFQNITFEVENEWVYFSHKVLKHKGINSNDISFNTVVRFVVFFCTYHIYLIFM